MNERPRSASFPFGLPHLRSEAEARASLSIMDVIRAGAHTRVRHKPCPFCLQEPSGLARRVGQTFIVGCESDICADSRVTAQASGDTVEAAWAAWDERGK